MQLNHDKQMEVFSQFAVKQFINKMVARLRRDYGAAVAVKTNRELESVVRQAIAAGGVYGLKMAWEIEKLLEIMVSMGPDFETRADTAWVRKILLKSHESSTDRFSEIYARLESRSPPG